MSWFWLALSAAVLWGLGYAINQATLKHFTPLELLLFESTIVFFVFTIYFIGKGNFSCFITKLANPKHLLLIVSNSIIYIIASILILKSIYISNSTLAAIIESCYPIFTVLFVFILFKEFHLNLASIIGSILILTGVIIVKAYG